MKKLVLVVLSATFLLQGCAAAIVAGAAGTASAINDRRSIGKQIDDENIEINAAIELAKDREIKDKSHINVVSFNGSVLLVGQAPTEGLKSKAGKIVSQINGVVRVHNQVRIAQPVALSTRTNDLWITSKVKANLIAEKNIDGMNVKVTTEDSEVFLMGLLTHAEATKATEVARNINGVARVIKVFEYQ